MQQANQARSEEEEKDSKDRSMARKAAQQNKNTSEELKQGMPAQLRLTKQGEEHLTPPILIHNAEKRIIYTLLFHSGWA